MMKKIAIGLIKLYKYFISPLLPGGCRYVPSCSEYAVDAITKYGAFKGVYLSARRIARCHPFHPGGFDPVK
ncbi:MAG: membrane protein insertion efficiency factor YidD [Nitrospirae bacterium]|nr:membrane protein insertion efficiency factor YidD [Nitrospirota bacterium]